MFGPLVMALLAAVAVAAPNVDPLQSSLTTARNTMLANAKYTLGLMGGSALSGQSFSSSYSPTTNSCPSPSDAAASGKLMAGLAEPFNDAIASMSLDVPPTDILGSLNGVLELFSINMRSFLENPEGNGGLGMGWGVTMYCGGVSVSSNKAPLWSWGTGIGGGGSNAGGLLSVGFGGGAGGTDGNGEWGGGAGCTGLSCMGGADQGSVESWQTLLEKAKQGCKKPIHVCVSGGGGGGTQVGHSCSLGAGFGFAGQATIKAPSAADAVASSRYLRASNSTLSNDDDDSTPTTDDDTPSKDDDDTPSKDDDDTPSKDDDDTPTNDDDTPTNDDDTPTNDDDTPTDDDDSPGTCPTSGQGGTYAGVAAHLCAIKCEAGKNNFNKCFCPCFKSAITDHGLPWGASINCQ